MKKLILLLLSYMMFSPVYALDENEYCFSVIDIRHPELKKLKMVTGLVVIEPRIYAVTDDEILLEKFEELLTQEVDPAKIEAYLANNDGLLTFSSEKFRICMQDFDYEEKSRYPTITNIKKFSIERRGELLYRNY